MKSHPWKHGDKDELCDFVFLEIKTSSHNYDESASQIDSTPEDSPLQKLFPSAQRSEW
jgi:hypothetical protein